MKLTLLEGKTDKAAAQSLLNRLMRAAWNGREVRRVVWRPSSQDMDISHNGEYWFASDAIGRAPEKPRYWNPLGSYNETGNLQIAVEINIPISSNERRVSGFFAKDGETDDLYLMHDGGVGGGREGIGRDAFLAWSGEKPVPVYDSRGDVRFGIIVGPLKPHLIADHIARFAQKAAAFKQAVKDGSGPDAATIEELQRSYDDYYREFSGKKKGQRAREFEYISRHGDVVHALSKWRTGASRPNERIVKNAFIDLGVEVANVLTEIYEVKTNADRQTLYTAIGQIFVHGVTAANTIKRYLVLPSGEPVPQDVAATLRQFQIDILFFELSKVAVRII